MPGVCGVRSTFRSLVVVRLLIIYIFSCFFFLFLIHYFILTDFKKEILVTIP